MYQASLFCRETDSAWVMARTEGRASGEDAAEGERGHAEWQAARGMVCSTSEREARAYGRRYAPYTSLSG